MPEVPTTLITLLVTGVAIVGMIAAVLAAIRAFYRVPNADEALVKTGGSQPSVSTGGGLWVIPMFHKVTRVSLRAVKIPINRVGEDALPTANKIPAEIIGELIVRVDSSNNANIILAAQSLGSESEETGHTEGQMERIIKQQVDSLVTDALRTAAFKKPFEKLNSEKKEFADEVTQLLAEDLGKLGLTLVAVTIPSIKQGAFTKDAGDVFAAEGQRNVAETVAKNRQETNAITREAEVKIQEQDVAARKRQLALELERKRLEAEQTRQVAEYEATQATEQKKAILTQEQLRAIAEAEQAERVAKAAIAQDQAVKAAEIERDQALATQRAQAAAKQKEAEEEAARIKAQAEIARQKAVEASAIEKDQTIKVADQQRQQAVSEAEISREVAVAAKRAEEALARAKQAEAEAEQQRAEQEITTVQATASADREKRVVAIKAEEEATKAKVAADRDAYVQTKKAEADRDAAQKRAEAARAEAEGRAHAVRAEAQGRAESLKLAAQAEADARTVKANAEFDAADKEAKAKIALAAAALEEGKARAESERLLVEARNAVSKETMLRDVALKVVEVAPFVARELMAPVAKVSDVKVLQINGLGGGAGEGDGANLPSTILGAGLAASGALPLVREAVQTLVANPDVQALAGMATGAAKSAIAETAKAARGETT